MSASAKAALSATVGLLLGCAPTHFRVPLKAPKPPPARYSISTQGQAATEAAESILAKGGNLFDAAIAASFVISVERPHSTGIGGGGFWLSYHAKSKSWLALDFRERSPRRLAFSPTQAAASPQRIPSLLQDSPAGGGIPGFVKAMGWLHERYSSKRVAWKELLEPAIRLADQGFAVYPALAQALNKRQKILIRSPDASQIFLHPDGSPLIEGEILRQPDLARTLRNLAKKGANSFYSGDLSKKISTGLAKIGSTIDSKDLSSYRVRERAPLITQVMGRTLVLMPPPSSGGILLHQILRLLEPDLEPLQKEGLSSEWGIHRVSQALQTAFADRARYLGDPEFSPIPSEMLLSPEYLKRRRELMLSLNRGERVLPSSSLFPDSAVPVLESSETTHLSLIDREGNAVSTTQSINGWMGSGYVIPGTGILLNNTLDDFSVAAGVGNLYGAIGALANRIAPGKAPLSSMTPTIVMSNEPSEEDRPELAIGAPGGTRIISCVAQTLLRHWIEGNSLPDAVRAPRIHHQWMPDELVLENPAPREQFSKGVVQALTERGHRVRQAEVHCRVMAASSRESASDPRDFGTAITRY